MDVLFSYLNNLVYVVLAGLALWGAYCVVMVWRRVGSTRFVDEYAQDEFLSELEQTLTAKNFGAATELCDGDRRAMPQLALYAIHHRELSYDKLRHRLAERFQQDVMSDIEHRLSWVGTVIKSAPMIGLLGTVMGMMGAFANLAQPGTTPDPVEMASDIQFALITTACGLAIAVPLVLATASINIRVRKMEDLVGWGLTRLFESIKIVLPSS
ncbi:MAG: MotA/TolQ/ExbB proton channel family protein [Planctomycetes bacterium]|nr:MotA/TolQ/ExbB proton channel family protein [Planctomycetota bacterium]